MGHVAGRPGMVLGTGCAGIIGMIFGVCMRLTLLLLSFGLTIKDTTRAFSRLSIHQETVSLQLLRHLVVADLLLGDAHPIVDIVQPATLHIEGVLAKAAPMVEDHSLGTTGRNLDLGSDCVGAVDDTNRRCLRHLVPCLGSRCSGCAASSFSGAGSSIFQSNSAVGRCWSCSLPLGPGRRTRPLVPLVRCGTHSRLNMPLASFSRPR